MLWIFMLRCLQNMTISTFATIAFGSPTAFGSFTTALDMMLGTNPNVCLKQEIFKMYDGMGVISGLGASLDYFAFNIYMFVCIYISNRLGKLFWVDILQTQPNSLQCSTHLYLTLLLICCQGCGSKDSTDPRTENVNPCDKQTSMLNSTSLALNAFCCVLHKIHSVQPINSCFVQWSI